MLNFEINESILNAYSEVRKAQIHEAGPIIPVVVWTAKRVLAILIAAGAKAALKSQAPKIARQLTRMKLPYKDGVRWLKDLVSSTPKSVKQIAKNSSRNTVGNVKSPISKNPPNPNNADKFKEILKKGGIGVGIGAAADVASDKLRESGYEKEANLVDGLSYLPFFYPKLGGAPAFIGTLLGHYGIQSLSDKKQSAEPTDEQSAEPTDEQSAEPTDEQPSEQSRPFRSEYGFDKDGGFNMTIEW